jgi:hypothetical protein
MEPKTPETNPVVPHSSEKVVQPPTDFKHRFLASVGTFLVDENPQYRLEADHTRGLIFLRMLQTWHNFSAVPHLGQQLSDIARAMVNEFGLLIDLSAIHPDSDGVVLAPAIPNRGVILDAGLVKVANVLPHDCDELVHGPHSISVNSVKMRPFHGWIQAESWLTAH